MAKGGYPGMGGMGGMNIQQMMKQAQQMQQRMQKTQEELQTREFSASAGGGMVTAVALGSRTLKSLETKQYHSQFC